MILRIEDYKHLLSTFELRACLAHSFIHSFIFIYICQTLLYGLLNAVINGETETLKNKQLTESFMLYGRYGIETHLTVNQALHIITCRHINKKQKLQTLEKCYKDNFLLFSRSSIPPALDTSLSVFTYWIYQNWIREVRISGLITTSLVRKINLL